jgi:hypothetical protein
VRQDEREERWAWAALGFAFGAVLGGCGGAILGAAAGSLALSAVRRWL